MFAYLGVDVAKATFDVALVSQDLCGQAGKLRHKQFANRSAGFVALTAWLAKQEITQVHACLEATGPYSLALADYLHEAGHKVSVVNPLRIQAFAKSQLSRNKTDKA